jgi:uncharacterized protein (TIGR02266 family)
VLLALSRKLSGEGLAMLPTVGEEVYQDGKTIVEEGMPGNQVYVIRSGAVEISKTIKGKKCIIAILEPGDMFGELTFIRGGKRTATARAVGDTCVEIVDSAYLHGEFDRLSPELRNILESVVRRYQHTIDRAMDLSSRREPRTQKTLSLQYADKKAVINALTENASSGGLFVNTENPLEKDEHFQIELHLPGIADPVKVKSKVIWTRKDTKEPDKPNGMGIKFVEITKEAKQTLKKYLNI